MPNWTHELSPFIVRGPFFWAFHETLGNYEEWTRCRSVTFGVGRIPKSPWNEEKRQWEKDRRWLIYLHWHEGGKSRFRIRAGALGIFGKTVFELPYFMTSSI
jgi:hypothetical protein